MEWRACPLDRRLSVSAALGVALVLTTSTAANPQGSPSRFLFADTSLAPAVALEPQVIRARPAHINFASLGERASSSEFRVPAASLLELNLFPDVRLTALLDRVEVISPQAFAWIGQVSGIERSSVILSVYGDALAGSISLPGAAFEIRYLGDGVHMIQEVNASAFPNEAPPVPVAEADLAPVQGGDLQDTGDVFDLMVVYTAAARAGAGGTSGINSLIALGVAETNTAYANAGIIPRLRLVHTAEVAYTESLNSGTDLTRLRGTSDGYMDSVHSLRNATGADLVKLVVNNAGNACGIGYLMSGVSSGFAPFAFTVTQRSCISPNYTFAHELGHNMGCNHAPGDDPTVTPGAFSYSFGYKDPGNAFRTVMAYTCSGGGCPRALRFSSPSYYYLGRITGTSTQNNGASINGVRTTVANWRQAVGTSAPGAPSNLSASATGSAITLRWSAPTSGGAPTAYIVEAGSAPGLANLAAVNTGSTATSFATSGVPNGRYYVRVRATNAAGTGAPSNEATLIVGPTPCTTPPPAPGSLSVTKSGTTVTFTWAASAGASSYVLEAGSSPGAANLFNQDIGATTTLTASAPNGLFYVRVRAKNACGVSGPSNEISFTIP